MNYKQKFCIFHGIGEQDKPLCWIDGCCRYGVDVHHVENKGMGGSKTKDSIDNLILLCREHHNDAHNEKITKQQLKSIIYEKLGKDSTGTESPERQGK